MKLTRKQAILVLLAVPGGIAQVPEKPTEYGLHLRLADGPINSWNPEGWTYFEVTYNGQTKRFTAKEIWEALA